MSKEKTETKIRSSSSMTRIFKRFLPTTDSDSDEEVDIKKYELPLTIVQPGDVKTTMKDIGGYHEAKLEVIEFVNFLHNKENYLKLGAKVPKGALLYGPPGTGKTLLCRACAGEGNIPFISCASANFLVSPNGPKKLRKVFKIARKLSPCILFFDEIDCIGRARNNFQSTPQSQSMTEELLVQLDGFEEHKDKIVVVFGATNSYEELDLALKRPGRFDRSIEMPEPDVETRMEIARVHLAPLTTSLDKEALARKLGMLTVSFTGAQIASLCNESAMIAARNSAEEITAEHFDKAFDRVKFGVKKEQELGEKEKKIAAYHEAGHAVAGWRLTNVKPITKVSITPNAKGNFSCSIDQPVCPELLTKHEMMNMVAMHLTGIASEQIVFGKYGTNSAKDLEDITKFVSQMSGKYGLMKSFGKMNVTSAFAEIWHVWESDMSIVQCGDKTFEEAFKEMDDVISAGFEIAKSVCLENRELLDKVANALIEKDCLNFEDLETIFGSSVSVNNEALLNAEKKSLPAGLLNWNKSKE